MATIESIVEAFARGLARGLVEQTEPQPRVKRTGRRREPLEPAPSSVTEPVDTGLIHSNGAVDAPVTQAELDRIERILQGELPKDVYMPGEGVPVTGPNP